MNNREISIFIWLFIFFVFLLIWKNTRNDGIQILKSAFGLIKVPALTFFFLYQMIVLILLCMIDYYLSFDFWNLKDYAIIALFSILPNLADNEGKIRHGALRQRLIASFTLATFISFVIKQYSYSLVMELFIVPIFAIIAVLIGISQSMKNKLVANFFQYIILLFALFALIHSCVSMIETRDFINLSFWMSFLIDPLGWLINIPLFFIFIYVGQLDVLLSFFEEKKTFWSFFKYLWNNKKLSDQLDLKQLHVSLITKVELGGLIRRCYQITFKDRASKTDADNFILAFRTMKGPKSMYKGEDRFFPLRINCINGSHHRIDFWEDERLEKTYQTGEFRD